MQGLGASGQVVGGLVQVQRRTFVKLGIAGAVVAAGAAVAVVARAAPPQAPTREPAAKRVRVVPLARYSFTATVYDGKLLSGLASLEAVWADTRYLRMSAVAVKYIGSKPQVLTAEENAAVNAASAAGAQGTREQICLAIVAACTRIDPRTVYAGFTVVGRPIIDGALTIAPQAPQAAVMKRWINAGMPSTGTP